MALTGDLIKEYLVGLGFQVDEKSMSSFDKAMKTAEKSALGIIGVIASATAGIMKFIGSTYEKDKQLERDAKAMNRTIEQTRAHANALDVLGATADQLKNDASLQSVYADLVDIGAQMALPEGSEGIDTIDTLVDAFRKLKLTASYALDWIGYHIKTVAAGPLQYFTGFMDRMQVSFQSNLPEITEWVGIAVNAVLSFAEVILRVGEMIGQLIGRIPGPILAIGAAVAALWAIIRAGPVGWISAAIAAVLLLLDDLFTYLDGGDALLGTFWGALIGWVQRGIEAINRLKPIIENVKQWFLNMFTGVRDESGNIDWSQLGQNIHNGIASAFTTAVNWLKELILGKDGAEADWAEVGTALRTGIETAFTGFGTWLKGILTGTDGKGVSWSEAGKTIWEKIKTGFSSAGGFLLGLFLGDAADTTSWSAVGKQIWESIKSGFDTAGDWLEKLFTGGEAEGEESAWAGIGEGIWKKITGALNKISVEDISKALSGLAGKLGKGIAKALEGVGGLADLLTGGLTRAINTGGSAVGTAGGAAGGAIASAASALIQPILDKLTEDGFISGLIENAGDIVASIINVIFKGEAGKIEGAAGIVTQIFNAIAGIDFDEVGGALADAAGKIIDGIVVGFGEITDVGEKLFGAIANGLTTLGESGAGSDVGGALAGLAQKIIDGIATGLADVDFETLVENIGKGIIGAISFLGDIAGALSDWILSDSGSAALGNLGSSIWDAIWAGLKGAINIGEELLSTLLDQVNKILPDFLKWTDNEARYAENRSSSTGGGGGGGARGSDDGVTTGDRLTAEGLKTRDIEGDGGSGAGFALRSENTGESEPPRTGGGGGSDNRNAGYSAGFELKPEEAEAVKSELEEDLSGIVVGKDAQIDTESASAAGEQLVSTIAEAVTATEPELTEAMTAAIENTVQGMMDTLSEDQAGSIAQTFSEALITAIEETYASILEIWEKFPEEMKTLFNLARLRAVAAFQQITGQMQTIAANVKKAFDDIPGHITTAFQNAASGAIDAFSGVAAAVGEQVAAVKASIDSVGGSGGDGKAPHTTVNAEGGIYDNPTTTRVAEDHRREYIIPAEKPQVAIPLIQSLLADMGITAESLTRANSMLGIGPAGNVMPSYAQPSTTYNTQESRSQNITIDARSTVNVSGANPTATGNAVARAQERRLVRNVKGALVAP